MCIRDRARRALFNSDKPLSAYKCDFIRGKDGEFVDKCLAKKDISGPRCGVVARQSNEDSKQYQDCKDVATLNTDYKTKVKATKDADYKTYCAELKTNYRLITGKTEDAPRYFECACSEKALSSMIIQSFVSLLVALYIFM
eukprot:TRINITY_DN8177_c0_g1_i1.p2 TRINITY_DN8177_c0_g1~~TRINITY_DN8177_c0_g1_i1.p2  ORF type:complete len:141 (+),score=27.34 TRINITY_DN8177_c0_g1_i1:65-487(+)